MWVRLLQSTSLIALTATVLISLHKGYVKRNSNFRSLIFSPNFSFHRNSIKEWTFLSPQCLRFVFIVTLWDAKLHGKERSEDRDIRCLYTGEDPSVKRQVWTRAKYLNCRKWRSEPTVRTHLLLKDTKQMHQTVLLKLQGKGTLPMSRKSFPAPSGRPSWAPWAMEGYLRRRAAGHVSLYLAESNTASFSLILAYLNPSVTTERWWDRLVGPTSAISGNWK